MLKETAPISRSEQEIAGYRDALNLIHESGEHMPFTTNIVLQLHGLLYRYLSNPDGRWKASDNEIIETHPDSTKKIRFVPTTAFLTPTAMNELTQKYAKAVERQKLAPIILVPLAILDFLCIHPLKH